MIVAAFQIPITLSEEEMLLVRAHIRMPPPTGTLATIRMGDVLPASTLLPIPKAVLDKVPTLMGAKFTTDKNNAIIIVSGTHGRVTLVIPPRSDAADAGLFASARLGQPRGIGRQTLRMRPVWRGSLGGFSQALLAASGVVIVVLFLLIWDRFVESTEAPPLEPTKVAQLSNKPLDSYPSRLVDGATHQSNARSKRAVVSQDARPVALHDPVATTAQDNVILVTPPAQEAITARNDIAVVSAPQSPVAATSRTDKAIVTVVRGREAASYQVPRAQVPRATGRVICPNDNVSDFDLTPSGSEQEPISCEFR